MPEITLTINGQAVQAAQGSTILAAATAAGIHIPTLCTLKGLDPRANCRLCVVEVAGSRTFQPACATPVANGMAVETNTPALRASRKTTLELLLARHSVDCHHCLRIGSSKCADLDPVFCEMCFFCDCVRDGICELQALAREYEVDALPYEVEATRYDIDDSTGCVVRNPNKCIQCRRCVDVCVNVQTVHALSVTGRGPSVQVAPALGKPLADTACVQCGRCVQVCPTGAVYEREEMDGMLYHAHSYDTISVALLADDVLEELATLSQIAPSTLDIGRVAAGLKKVGVDYVLAADAVQSLGQAQAAEYLLQRGTGPEGPAIITSSHAAAQFAKHYFPALAANIRQYPSAQQQFSGLVQGEWGRRIKAQTGKKLCTISVSGNNDNAGEAAQSGSVDYVLNARELYRLFLRTGVNLEKIRPIEPDVLADAAPLPAALDALFQPVAWCIGSAVEELDLTLDGRPVKAAVGKTLGHARQLLQQVENRESPYQIIKISS